MTPAPLAATLDEIEARAKDAAYAFDDNKGIEFVSTFPAVAADVPRLVAALKYAMDHALFFEDIDTAFNDGNPSDDVVRGRIAAILRGETP